MKEQGELFQNLLSSCAEPITITGAAARLCSMTVGRSLTGAVSAGAGWQGNGVCLRGRQFWKALFKLFQSPQVQVADSQSLLRSKRSKSKGQFTN